VISAIHPLYHCGGKLKKDETRRKKGGWQLRVGSTQPRNHWKRKDSRFISEGGKGRENQRKKKGRKIGRRAEERKRGD